MTDSAAPPPLDEAPVVETECPREALKKGLAELRATREQKRAEVEGVISRANRDVQDFKRTSATGRTRLHDAAGSRADVEAGG